MASTRMLERRFRQRNRYVFTTSVDTDQPEYIRILSMNAQKYRVFTLATLILMLVPVAPLIYRSNNYAKVCYHRAPLIKRFYSASTCSDSNAK